MNLKQVNLDPVDVLVIGGGGAGLRAAIAAREKGANVLLVSKSPVGLGNNTSLSKAAFAAATAQGDSRDNPDIHYKDTLEGGRYINNPRLARKMTQKVLDEVSFLQKCGAPFETEDGRFLIVRSAGHSFARSYQGEKRQGTSFTIPMRDYAGRVGVKFLERILITKLFIGAGGISGAMGIDEAGDFLVLPAKTVILATGGIGQAYLKTNNAAGITGDGQALAFNLGIPLRDMEFIQFYPTAIGGNKLILYEMFVLNLGAILRNSKGEDIVAKHGLKDPVRMTRDRLAQAIFREIREGNDFNGNIIMDLTPVSEENLRRQFHLLPPGALSTGKKEFLVSPTVHFTMGGIVADEETRTKIKGLFVCGEVTGGTHGANRLGSNALAQVFVSGAVAGENAAYLAEENDFSRPESRELSLEKDRLELFTGETGGNLKDLTHSLKEVMWLKAGILRNEAGLKDALNKIDEIRGLNSVLKVVDIEGLIKKLEIDNMLLSAEMVTRAALLRKESRGSHCREDFPEENPDWQKSLFIRNESGKMVLEKMPVDSVK